MRKQVATTHTRPRNDIYACRIFDARPSSDVARVLPRPLLPALNELPTVKPGQRHDIPALAGFAYALAITTLASDATQLVVTANPIDAQRLCVEMAWFAPDLRVCVLPDWETLPYDSLSPHQDLVSERLATRYTISRGEADLVMMIKNHPTLVYRRSPCNGTNRNEGADRARSAPPR